MSTGPRRQARRYHNEGDESSLNLWHAHIKTTNCKMICLDREDTRALWTTKQLEGTSAAWGKAHDVQSPHGFIMVNKSFLLRPSSVAVLSIGVQTRPRV